MGVKYPGQPTQQRSYRAAAGPASQTVTAARAKPKPKPKPAAPQVAPVAPAPAPASPTPTAAVAAAASASAARKAAEATAKRDAAMDAKIAAVLAAAGEKKTGTRQPAASMKRQRPPKPVRPSLSEQLASIGASAGSITDEIRKTHKLDDHHGTASGKPLLRVPARAFTVGKLGCRYPSPVQFFADQCT